MKKSLLTKNHKKMKVLLKVLAMFVAVAMFAACAGTTDTEAEDELIPDEGIEDVIPKDQFDDDIIDDFEDDMEDMMEDVEDEFK